ncbi:MAG: hypothetical protein AAGI11_15595 [Pseudomonadota bacterium]
MLFKPRWMLVGLAYQFDESGDRSVARDFTFDGREFQAGVSVDTEMEIDTYILDLMYSAFRNERGEILIGGGLHVVDIEASITGRAFVGEAERESSTGTSEVLAPLPNIRVQGAYAINDKWLLHASMGWLSLNYEDYEGAFAYLHPRLAYSITENFAATLGYQFVTFDITHDKSSRRENEFNMDFRGPTLMVNYRF